MCVKQKKGETRETVKEKVRSGLLKNTIKWDWKATEIKNKQTNKQQNKTKQNKINKQTANKQNKHQDTYTLRTTSV